MKKMQRLLEAAKAQRETAATLDEFDEGEWEEWEDEDEEPEEDEPEEDEWEEREERQGVARHAQHPKRSGDANAGAPSTHNERGESSMSTSKASTSTDNATVEPQKEGVVAALGSWTKRAASAGVEGAKDGAAFAAAEVLTMTLISGLSVEFPFLMMAYRSSAIAQKIMQIAVPYLIGAAATMNLLPGNPETIISLCERALRASISANVGPIMRRLEGPIMEAISQAGRQVRASDAGSGESWK
jgi:hypothetical protein